jgi:hypothetical protein
MNLFELICKFMHFNNSDSKDIYLGPPKLFKMCPVMPYLNRKFQNLCILDQNIAVDKSSTVWKGRLSFKQYIPLKSSELNLKSFVNPAHAICGPSLFILEDNRFQSTLTSEEKSKNQLLCCLLSRILFTSFMFFIVNTLFTFVCSIQFWILYLHNFNTSQLRSNEGSWLFENSFQFFPL